MNLFTKLLIAGPVGVGVAALGKKLKEKGKEWAKEHEEKKAREAEQLRREWIELGDLFGPYYLNMSYRMGICCAGYAKHLQDRADLDLLVYVFFDNGHFYVACEKRADLVITSSSIQDKIYSFYSDLAPIFLREAFSEYDEPATLARIIDDFKAVLNNSLFSEPTCEVDTDGYKLKKYFSKFLASNEDNAYTQFSPIFSFNIDSEKYAFKGANVNFWVERVMHYKD